MSNTTTKGPIVLSSPSTRQCITTEVLAPHLNASTSNGKCHRAQAFIAGSNSNVGCFLSVKHRAFVRINECNGECLACMTSHSKCSGRNGEVSCVIRSNRYIQCLVTIIGNGECLADSLTHATEGNGFTYGILAKLDGYLCRSI